MNRPFFSQNLPLVHVFADESSQNKHRHLLLGCVLMDEEELAAIHTGYETIIRDYELNTREIKWSKVSKVNLSAYTALINEFFRLNHQNKAHFHYLSVDTSTFDHKTHNGGDKEVGFNKLIFQLLLHRVGRRYGNKHRFMVHLDERTTDQSTEEMRQMLNSTLRRDWRMIHRPFRSVDFRNSAEYLPIQICDLLLGACAYRLNGHDQKSNASRHKIALASHVDQCSHLVQPEQPTHWRATRFSHWEFKYRNPLKRR